MNETNGATPAASATGRDAAAGAPGTGAAGRQRPGRARRFALRAAMGAAAALVLFAVAGFLVAPPIARQQLERVLSEQLRRPVTIERVRFNPFALSATVEKLAVADGAAGTAPLLTFDVLHVDLATSSLLRLAPVIQSVRLARPHLRLVRLEDGRYNVQDLIDAATAPPAATASQPAAPPRFAVFNIELDDGRVDFDDRPEKTVHALTELRIGVPFLSSIPSQVDITVQPELRAKINGAPFGLTGTTKPFKDTHETTLALDLSDLQLAKYLEYSPVPLAIRVPSGRLDAQLRLSLSTQQERLQTLTLTGSARVRELVVQHANGAPMLSLASLAVDVDALDLVARQLRIRRVALDKPDVRVVRRKDGSLDVLGVVSASGAAPGAAPARPAAPAAADPSKAAGERSATPGTEAAPMSMRAESIALSGGTLRFTDETPDKPLQLKLDNVGVTLESLALGGPTGAGPAALKVSFDVEPKGRFSYAGTLQPVPLRTEGALALDGLRIASFAPYYAPFVDVVVTGGLLSTKGALAVDLGATPPRVTWRGDLGVTGFSSLDGPTSQELLRWKSLQVAGIDFRLDPPAVGIDQVSLADFYSRLIVNADGTLNLQGLVRKNAPAAGDTAASPAAPDTSAGAAPAARADGAAPAAAKGPPVRIGRVVLKGGTINFSDFFVRPNYSAELQGVTGTVSEMNAQKAGDVDLRGRIGGAAPIEIVGQLNPFSPDLFLAIDASARDIELPGLTPYSVKYAGYGIERGKLSVKVKYHLENRKLEAQNNVRLDQLTFGARVDSPTATQLPVLLAVALLKDRNGVIDIDLPISGSLDDPQFSVGGVIVRVIVNLITKAITAPFALLGALFGGGEELAWAEFAPGSARLADGDDAKLKSLAKALEERPGLRLDIAGRADPAADREALKRLQLERQLKALKLRQAAAGKPERKDAPKSAAKDAVAPAPADRKDGDTDVAALDEVTFAPGERERLLASAWRALPAGGAPAAGGTAATAATQPSTADMEQLLLARLTVSDDDLQALASARSATVKAWFADTAKIATERLFIVAPKIGAEGIKDGGKPSRVDFAVK
jgi:hypothetical protein